MITFYNKYAANTFSQNGEDGLTTEIFNRIGTPPTEVAEWGIHNGKFCSNTRLWVEQGAHGTWIEYDHDLYLQAQEQVETLNVDLFYTAVTPQTVNELVPQNCDLISIDTDGTNDYYTWQAFTGKPSVVIVEVNSSYMPIGDRLEDGANYSIMVRLAIQKGYFLLCHTGNCVFVKNEYRKLFPEIKGDGLKNYSLYFQDKWL